MVENLYLGPPDLIPELIHLHFTVLRLVSELAHSTGRVVLIAGGEAKLKSLTLVRFERAIDHNWLAIGGKIETRQRILLHNILNDLLAVRSRCRKGIEVSLRALLNRDQLPLLRLTDLIVDKTDLPLHYGRVKVPISVKVDGSEGKIGHLIGNVKPLTHSLAISKRVLRLEPIICYDLDETIGHEVDDDTDDQKAEDESAARGNFFTPMHIEVDDWYCEHVVGVEPASEGTRGYLFIVQPLRCLVLVVTLGEGRQVAELGGARWTPRLFEEGATASSLRRLRMSILLNRSSDICCLSICLHFCKKLPINYNESI